MSWSQKGYSVTTPSGNSNTVYDYCGRIRKICKTESLIWETLAARIDGMVRDYGPGGIKEKEVEKAIGRP